MKFRRDEAFEGEGEALTENNFSINCQHFSLNQEKASDMEVPLSHQLEMSSEDGEEEEEENLTGEAAGEYWMRLATAGALHDDEQEGEADGAPHDGLGGGEEVGGNQYGGDATSAEGKKGESKEDNEISFECQDNDLFSEEEEETHIKEVKRQRLDEENETKEEVLRDQDTGIDVYSLGGNIGTTSLS